MGLVEMRDCVTRVSTELVSFFLWFLENCNSAKIRCVSSSSPTREPKLSAARVFFRSLPVRISKPIFVNKFTIKSINIYYNK